MLILQSIILLAQVAYHLHSFETTVNKSAAVALLLLFCVFHFDRSRHDMISSSEFEAFQKTENSMLKMFKKITLFCVVNSAKIVVGCF